MTHLFKSLRRGGGRLAAGFTLAEVLITLGIIGIVASLTMPSLIQNHRKKVVETRLQKFYSTINQAIILSELDNGEKTEWRPVDTDDFWNNYISSYLKYLKVEDSGTYKIVYFTDGSLVAINIYSLSNSDGQVIYQSYGGHFVFFPEAKNYSLGMISQSYGRKSFRFGFWPNETSSVFKYHSKKGVEPYLANWGGDLNALYSNTTYGCNEIGNGSWCTAIIQNNGWKIPDNYPVRI